jgi:hypothetical protein
MYADQLVSSSARCAIPELPVLRGNARGGVRDFAMASVRSVRERRSGDKPRRRYHFVATAVFLRGFSRALGRARPNLLPAQANMRWNSVRRDLTRRYGSLARAVELGSVTALSRLNHGFECAPRKGPCLLQVKVLSGKLSVRPGSYRGGEEGNRIAEALGTSAHHGWVCESTGRNACEARAGLERDVESADLPFEQGRPPDPVGATDR